MVSKFDLTQSLALTVHYSQPVFSSLDVFRLFEKLVSMSIE